MACTCVSAIYEKKFDRLLNMSMVPRACQECQLNSTGCTRAESIEWVLQLAEKPPIWSRLIDINTSGYKRRLPMSMTKEFHTEINGRLWSLWGHQRKHNMPKNYKKANNGYHMATTVMALCCARVISLNIWNSLLMDSIAHSARKYFKKSLKRHSGLKKTDFQLGHLFNYLELEGIKFKISLKTVQRGRLYSIPLESEPNLAFALKEFFRNYQFGLVECCHRILGFGFIDGPNGGYFMYDAQSINKPLFSEGYYAPYLLRSNHLQVLLYCMIVALNVSVMHAHFCLHHLCVKVIQLKMPKGKPDKYRPILPPRDHILPEDCWVVPSVRSINIPSSQVDPLGELQQFKQMVKDVNYSKKPIKKPKYSRKRHNISKAQQEKSIIKMLVDPDDFVAEGMHFKNDFLRFICSDTIVQKCQEDNDENRGFVRSLEEALFMGPENCLKYGTDFVKK